MPGASTSAQKMVWDLWKGGYVMESGIKIIKPKDIEVHQYITVNPNKHKMYI